MEIESMKEISITTEADNKFGDSENQASEINEEQRKESRETSMETDSLHEMPVSSGTNTLQDSRSQTSETVHGQNYK